MMKKAAPHRHRLRSHEEEVDSEGTWAISYGDMVTLLLTFFIVFFSVNPSNETAHKARALQTALLDVLNERSAKTTAGRAGVEDKLAIGDKPESGVAKHIAEKLKGQAHVVGDHLIVEFPNVSFFPSGKTELTKEGRAALDEFVKLYLPFAGQNKLSIRAYTDPRALRAGRRAHDNLELSALRSVAAMRVLQSSGIPLARMRLSGFGEHVTTQRELASLRPEDLQQTDATNRLARKVVLVIESEAL